jgi:cytochrome oxidase Cu insertion factor (SCO1/SenC/PrrC family)
VPVVEEPRAVAPVRRLVLAALMCLVLGGLGGVLAATTTRAGRAPAHFVPPRVPAYDFSLRNQDGRRTSLADARGKVVAMTFAYASCRDLCPAIGSDVVQAFGLVGSKDVVAYVVSVDPVGDTPKRVRDWIHRRGATGAAEFLIGTRKELRPVWMHYGIAPLQASPAEAKAAAAGADALLKANLEYASPQAHPPRYEAPARAGGPSRAGDAYPDPADLAYRGRARHAAGWDFEHSAYVLLIDKHGTQRLGIPFESLTPGSLARDIRALLAEP